MVRRVGWSRVSTIEDVPPPTEPAGAVGRSAPACHGRTTRSTSWRTTWWSGFSSRPVTTYRCRPDEGDTPSGGQSAGAFGDSDRSVGAHRLLPAAQAGRGSGKTALEKAVPLTCLDASARHSAALRRVLAGERQSDPSLLPREMDGSVATLGAHLRGRGRQVVAHGSRGQRRPVGDLVDRGAVGGHGEDFGFTGTER